MRCAWETVHRFSQNDRQLQGTPGAIAVLHTHSRRLDFQPHVHLVVPAAAIDAAKQRWRRKRRGKNGTYLFNERALAKVFRAKMLAAIEAAGICLPASYPREWVAHCKSVGSGEKALIYLGRYLYPVSYTHLDVYKRQPLIRGTFMTNARLPQDGRDVRCRNDDF